MSDNLEQKLKDAARKREIVDAYFDENGNVIDSKSLIETLSNGFHTVDEGLNGDQLLLALVQQRDKISSKLLLVEINKTIELARTSIHDRSFGLQKVSSKNSRTT
jgi:hypothetical protein